MNQADQEWLKNRVAVAVDDDFYLDRDEERRIKEEGASRSIVSREIELIIREQLDEYSAVSERALVEELDRLLHQFTDNDKKLDQKEERLALNKVVTPAPGKKVGLDPRVAEEYVASFCKANGASRSTDTKKWLSSQMGLVLVAVAVAGAGIFFATRPSAAKEESAAIPVQAKEVRPADTKAVRLNENDRAEIDDQLRRAALYVEKAQYTDPPESSAKASLDQIRQIDPDGQYRGEEVKGLASKIVDHYIKLAEKSAASNDLGAAAKWLARAKLLNRDREVILEKERALGLVKAER
ncbi:MULTISPECIES: hypothetical protein [unclassified Janthinobacterium]|uniref:hypothetical protein n=1 Tax=unclassified Janthinobacterium TaxID=2610881 RepID=UPI001610EA7D|nr:MULTISPECIES: hypothetical protein [unclassified Janthinobacterium]MBB5367672.1 hypothetical protein [Janthinobacterium sp. K2C7]MBB5379850.1 hypothetical protein [Janthinobacterium sp. K2Li3]MBB5386054.1 hypothetical protein [Janthinobacterium sp. K2E3]